VRKGIKFVVFAVVSVLMSHLFLSYFVGWGALTGWMTEAPAAHWGFFVAMAFVAALIFVDFAWFREQMCTIACPYARIQSVLMDRNSWIVSYDAARGEPRGKVGRADKQGAANALGDCVDCGACVRTCPTNIDIRQGLQMECIACTQCMDACDPVMEKLGRPTGLIRYTSENALDGKPTQVLRPRIFLYLAPVLVIATVFVVVIGSRGGGVEVNIGRIAGAPFIDMGDGTISNRLRFRLRNRTSETANFTVEAFEPAGSLVRVVGEQSIALEPGEQKRIETWVVVPATAFTAGSVVGHFRVVGDKGEVKDESEFMLLGPSALTGGGS
jgi:cytochrome c oxidase accessory protein FixG